MPSLKKNNQPIAENNSISTYPVLPIRDMVMFPHMIVPLFVEREKSLLALEEASKIGKVLLIAQKNPDIQDPNIEDIYDCGVVCNLLQILKLPNGAVKILVEGSVRVKVSKFIFEKKMILAEATPLYDRHSIHTDEIEAMYRVIRDQRFEEYARLNKRITEDVVESIKRIVELDRFCDFLSAHLILPSKDKQEILEMTDILQKMKRLLFALESEISIIEAENDLLDKVRAKVEDSQKMFYLQTKLSALQEEINNLNGEGKDENKTLEIRAKKKKMSKEAKEKITQELRRLKNMNIMSSEAGVVRSYVECILDLPWFKIKKENKDINQAGKVLNERHYGLEKVKERILEYLSVVTRTNSFKGPILCLIGPPGVGKTSLAKSIAEAMGRPFVKISLGGLRDEAEIKGHRRTYVGAMPGRLIQAMKRAGHANPLILLDEIDKMGSDYRGDPASALLEVLDPELNHEFIDHYLDLPYDLSKAMFIATANSYDIPQPLLDRLEVIKLSGYTDNEKLHIAKDYLWEKQLQFHGLKDEEVRIRDEVLPYIIRYYTREAGVRNLNREIAKIARKVVHHLTRSNDAFVNIEQKDVHSYLGVLKYSDTELEKKDLVGMVNGLAYTDFGGDVLIIETVAVYGKGDVKITGKLGDVMKESVYAAIGYIRANCLKLGIHPSLFNKRDLHVHVPEGATPKDGPSAGITIGSSIVSVLTGIAAHANIAMTGEITLRGRVLEIGGLKEKMLAAKRNGITRIIIPKSNEKNLEDIESDIKEGLEIILAESFSEVIKLVLVTEPQPLIISEAELSKQMSGDKE